MILSASHVVDFDQPPTGKNWYCAETALPLAETSWVSAREGRPPSWAQYSPLVDTS